MPEVTSADQATAIALGVLQKGYPYGFARPLRAVREAGTWIVEIDVGAIRTRIARVKIEASTGDVKEYEVEKQAS